MSNLNAYKTEVIGISSEIAIADYFNIAITNTYRQRGAEEIIALLKPLVPKYFEKYNIPKPVNHIALDQNPIDFELEDGQTLSVKSNQKGLGKVAPQIVGQPTSKTYFEKFAHVINSEIPTEPKEQRKLFKSVALNQTDEVMKVYWDYLFHCDYMIYFYDILTKTGEINSNPQAIVLNKLESPEWINDNFTFTQTHTSWNESNTVKYCGTSIGEFQVHNNRDCYKFRFIMDKVVKLLEQGKL